MRKRLSSPDVIAVVLLGALTCLFFWKITFTNLILTGLDVFTYFYPYRAYSAQALLAGRIPLWNPYLFGGVPFLANMQAAVLYPLHWPLLPLFPPKAVSLSVVLHVFLAALFTYLYARLSLGLGPASGFAAACVFALGGYLGAQVEHLNQLNVLAWFPLLLLLFDRACASGRPASMAALGLAVGLQFLAGHVQSSYIVLAALGLYALFPALWGWWKGEEGWSERLRKALAVYLGGVFWGVMLAAAQLIPTAELSRLSVRSGGLSYREAVSFSLKPHLLPLSLLPTFGRVSVFTEYIAYAGLLGLGLAVWGGMRSRHPRRVFFVFLAALGLFLALGGYNPFYFLLYKAVPGLAFFRAPARWLFLYAFGVGILAGLGVEVLECLWRERGSRFRMGIPVLLAFLCGELFLASRSLPYNHPTAPEAFSSLRTAPAHLLVARSQEAPFRILSLSDLTFDPGDLGEIRQMLSPQLPPQAVYDYVVATKEKEILAPNLPLLYGLQSLDGYDGGVLPLRCYLDLERLFLAEEDLSPDGRLRERLRRIPAGRFLSLLNVRYVIVDKVRDLWADGVYYDLAHRAVLGEGGVDEVEAELPRFPATSLGLVSYLEGTFEEGEPVCEVVIEGEGGVEVRRVLRAGADTAKGRGESASPSRARPVGRDEEGNSRYLAVWSWGEALWPVALRLRYLAGEGALYVVGVSLIDERTGAHRSLVISTSGRFRLVHSGDVKIYENLDVLPRAFVVHKARVIPDSEQALAVMKEGGFEPGKEIILAWGQGLRGEGTGRVRILSYEPERVLLEAELDAPGYLVLMDSHYPGWRAMVDGVPSPIVRADLCFRALRLEPGRHSVEFVFQPLSFRLGLALSVGSLVVALVVLAIGRKKRAPFRII